MRTSTNHFGAFRADEQPLFRRYFLKLFKSKKEDISHLRHPDAIPPAELKKQVIALGRGKKVSITRLSYEGVPEETPVAVKIIDIGNDHFTGKVVNVDREVSESQDTRLIFVKGGGGTIDFRFADGDILAIVEDVDEEIIEERSIDEVKEILEALDVGEDITISYYDKDKGGVINGVGKLTDKNLETLDFKVTLTLINEITLREPRAVALNLEKDQIWDLEVVL
jgi:hypothetical protein